MSSVDFDVVTGPPAAPRRAPEEQPSRTEPPAPAAPQAPPVRAG